MIFTYMRKNHLFDGADGRSRTATGYAHHPLKMACLPISPHRLFMNFYGSSGKSAGACSTTSSVGTTSVTLSTRSALPEK